MAKFVGSFIQVLGKRSGAIHVKDNHVLQIQALGMCALLHFISTNIELVELPVSVESSTSDKAPLQYLLVHSIVKYLTKCCEEPKQEKY